MTVSILEIVNMMEEIAAVRSRHVITAAISSIIFTISSIETVITVVIPMPSRWCTLNARTICAVIIPSLGFIVATSSTIIVAISIVVFIITPFIIGPLWGSTTILRWGCSAWWCSGGWWWGGRWSWWRGSSSTHL